jgi:hypothetical protein
MIKDVGVHSANRAHDNSCDQLLMRRETSNMKPNEAAPYRGEFVNRVKDAEKLRDVSPDKRANRKRKVRITWPGLP